MEKMEQVKLEKKSYKVDLEQIIILVEMVQIVMQETVDF
jgi:hypothetical protein